MVTSGIGLARPEGVITKHRCLSSTVSGKALLQSHAPLKDERGIALPMAMIVMAILTSLMIAFAVLATSESQIAGNQMAIKKITRVVTRLKWISPIGALCAGGENPPDTTTNVQISGNATINASNTSQYCPGVTPQAAVSSNGTAVTGGSATLIPPPGYAQSPFPCPNGANCNVTFPSTMTLTDSDMATLKALAKASGPGHYFNNGDQHWTSPPLNGLIFVDTPSGNPLTVNSPDSDKIEVQISGNWQSSIWSGWLVVAGSVRIDGNVSMKGLIYAQNDATLHATGNGAIEGAVISTNRVDSVSTTVDSAGGGGGPSVGAGW